MFFFGGSVLEMVEVVSTYYIYRVYGAIAHVRYKI